MRRNDRGDVLGFVHHPNAATAEPLENTIMGDNAAYDRTGSAHERALVTIPPLAQQGKRHLSLATG